ncbi:CT583 family protein [Chlamydia pecorum]|uniref:CT583 family protein n=1 Tax=Chlamydia pecorum TaxID=85991 RepID=UPI001E436346|nr:CT583 family protein [Chlamydia pecorum]UFP07259.1 pGP6-D family virulence protein [Chlamydia pecorum]CAH1098416.1 hypothetical protein IZS_PCPE_PV7855_00006 [Chlamydia pecorum]
MNKLNKEASIFFQKNQKHVKEEFKKKYALEAVFQTSLTQAESEQLDCLILDGNIDLEEQASEVLLEIKSITSQIKAIQKHHVLLIGEKIYRVREILNKSGSSSTTFSSWIGLVFHTKSSAYNALAYYELFLKLPSQSWRVIFQSIPYKTAYLLASRKGEIEDKMTVIEKIQGLPNSAAICILNKYLPSSRDTVISAVSSEEDINKVISDKLLELLKIVCLNPKISQYNMNLLQQLLESTLGNFNDTD